MKIIYPDNITSVTADSADANYPVANLENNIVKKIWKAASGVSTTNVTLSVSRGNACALFNTNATSITVTIAEVLTLAWNAAPAAGMDVTWNAAPASGMDVAWAGGQSTATTETFLLDAAGIGTLWVDYAATIETPHTVQLAMTQNAFATLYAGVAKAGVTKVYEDPFYGIQEGLHDYSIINELSSGSIYIRKRDVVRTFAFRIMEDRDVDFYEFMIDVMKINGAQPLAWRIVHDLQTDSEWVVFASTLVMPKGEHFHREQSYIDIELREVV